MKNYGYINRPFLFLFPFLEEKFTQPKTIMFPDLVNFSASPCNLVEKSNENLIYLKTQCLSRNARDERDGARDGRGLLPQQEPRYRRGLFPRVQGEFEFDDPKD